MQTKDDKKEAVFVNNTIDSNKLFAETNEITIIHNGEAYRLRLTSKGKLILTK